MLYLTVLRIVAWTLPPTHAVFKDFIVEVEATNWSPDKALYGVVLRQIDRNNLYRFWISGNGYHGFDKQQDGKLVEIFPHKSSSAIITGAATNLMRVECNGSRFVFYTNGEKLDEAEDSSFASGAIGLIAGSPNGKAQVSFDNLKVWA